MSENIAPPVIPYILVRGIIKTAPVRNEIKLHRMTETLVWHSVTVDISDERKLSKNEIVKRYALSRPSSRQHQKKQKNNKRR